MKAAKLRDLTPAEIEHEVGELREQIFRLKFQQASGQAENPLKVRLARRDLARALTVLREKERGAGVARSEA
jgi:large subunit ribosomal protein L29